MVWPWLPISAILFAATRKRWQAVSAASAKISPKRKLSWLSSPAEMGCCSATRRISFRIAGGKFTDAWFSDLALRLGGAPEILARATSIPSAEVPDIRPRTRSGLDLILKASEGFHHRVHREHREERSRESKRQRKWPCGTAISGCVCRQLGDLFF